MYWIKTSEISNFFIKSFRWSGNYKKVRTYCRQLRLSNNLTCFTWRSVESWYCTIWVCFSIRNSHKVEICWFNSLFLSFEFWKIAFDKFYIICLVASWIGWKSCFSVNVFSELIFDFVFDFVKNSWLSFRIERIGSISRIYRRWAEKSWVVYNHLS